MEIPEMLDILKTKEHLQTTGSGKNFWRQEKKNIRWKHFVRNAGNWGILYMKWI